ncbi:Golgi-associated PDZ and coiled-coil motif-containing protein-like [Stegodyphus dumicola]|uniref:Golgi-associated PDZ and coiled-coil motif-containing protein-like n=1 Tax=Stegodyphus dumicola TaxID=202533 RepID=UPI0015AA1BA6|nr:Golgi-associated PDZ and coiled-coil motif-containing protein-like [Stegodyphus dumicola]
MSHPAAAERCDASALAKELAVAQQELCEAQAAKAALQKELQHLLLQLHSAQLQVSAQMGHAEDSEAIKQKLENEMEQYRTNVYKETLTETQIHQLRRENEVLRQCNIALQSEVFGSRLAAKYLDKELAGRIQQIQLLGRDLKGGDHDRLWEQLEAEIHLHRHKTVIRACRAQSGLGSKLVYPPGHDFLLLKKKQGIGEVRTITLHKGENEGLGISITGGKEHGVPIVISEIHPCLPAWRSGLLFVGDAILSVNGIDLRNHRHMEAAKILSSQVGEITLEVVFVAPDEELTDEHGASEINFSYPFYDHQTTSQLAMLLNKNMADKGTDPIDIENSIAHQSSCNNSLDICNDSPKCVDSRNSDCEVAKACLSKQLSASSTESIAKENIIDAIIPNRKVLNNMWRSLMSEKNKSQE